MHNSKAFQNESRLPKCTAIGAILSALASGPKSGADIALLTGSSSGAVARDCTRLRKEGRIYRIDGKAGRGTVATYALPSDVKRSGPVKTCSVDWCGEPHLALGFCRSHYKKAKRRNLSGVRVSPHRVERTEAVARTIVNREPCFRCGVRGDIGCVHQPVEKQLESCGL